MTQKVVQIGSSAGIIIPKESLKELGMNIGDQVQVEFEAKAKTVTIKPLAAVNEELVAWTKGFINKYRQALEALARE